MKRNPIFSKYLPALIALTAILSGVAESKAQADLMFTQQWALPTLYNPAATGETDFIRIRGGARLQWIGITNAPKNFVATGDSPFVLMNKRIGAGVTVSQESIGLFSNLLVGAQGSYKLNILKGRLSLGLQLAYYNTKFKGSETYVPDGDDYHQPNDPSVPTQDMTGNAFDVSLGAFYTHKLFHVGISGMHLTNPTVKLRKEGSESTDTQEYETKLPTSIYFDAGCNIDLHNTLFTLQPSLFLGTDLSEVSAELSMRAVYNKFLSFGVGYRWNDAVCVMIGAEFKNFFLGYAFDYPTSSLGKVSAGSHEIVAGYQLKLDLSGKNTHSQRSIRIM